MKEKEFYSQKGTYNRVPLSKKIKAEKLIPIDIFDKFKSKGSYFLESAEVDMKWGRYSIIGLPSESSIKVKNSEIFLNLNGDEEKISSSDPLKFIEKYLEENFYPDTGNLPIFSIHFVYCSKFIFDLKVISFLDVTSSVFLSS